MMVFLLFIALEDGGAISHVEDVSGIGIATI